MNKKVGSRYGFFLAVWTIIIVIHNRVSPLTKNLLQCTLIRGFELESADPLFTKSIGRQSQQGENSMTIVLPFY